MNPERAAVEHSRNWGGWRPGAGRPEREDWQDDWLEAYAEIGKIGKAAKRAGVARNTVRAYLDTHPEFAEAAKDAHADYVESIEQKLEDQAEKTGNPVGYIVRLKAESPARYIERNITLSLSAHTDLAPEVGADLLRRILAGGVTDATLQALGPHEDSTTHALGETQIGGNGGRIIEGEAITGGESGA